MTSSAESGADARSGKSSVEALHSELQKLDLKPETQSLVSLLELKATPFTIFRFVVDLTFIFAT
jgi:hypothetical protein